VRKVHDFGAHVAAAVPSAVLSTVIDIDWEALDKVGEYVGTDPRGDGMSGGGREAKTGAGLGCEVGEADEGFC